MYYRNEWVVDWEKVKSFDDLKRIIVMMNISFDHPRDVSTIKDLVTLTKKVNVNDMSYMDARARGLI